MNDKTVRLHVGKTSRDSWIEVDGERLSNVKSVRVGVDANSVSQFEVTFIGREVDLEIDPEVWDAAARESVISKLAESPTEVR